MGDLSADLPLAPEPLVPGVTPLVAEMPQPPQEDIPQPPVSEPSPPIPEQPQQEKTAIELAEENLRKYIEGEPMGSVKSKAFCDTIDAIEYDTEIDNSNEKDAAYYRQCKANLAETIRQRSNELPGYSSAINEIVSLVMDLENAKVDPRERNQMRFLGKSSQNRTADLLVNIKGMYLLDASGWQPPSATSGVPSGTPPVAPTGTPSV